VFGVTVKWKLEFLLPVKQKVECGFHNETIARNNTES
jgi:hypothetical protein